MSLQQKINDDLKVAIATKNNPKRDLLRVVLAEISRQSKEISDASLIKILKKMCENAKECGTLSEIDLLTPYIPVGVDELTIIGIVNTIIEANDFTQKDLSKIMACAKERLGSDFDGKIVMNVIRNSFL